MGWGLKTIVVIILLLLLLVQWPVTYEALAQDGWVIRMNGLPTDSVSYTSAAIADSQTIWVTGTRSVYRTTNLGLTWTEANRPGDTLGLPLTAGLGTIDAWDALNAVVATWKGMIFRTSDGGMTWHKVFDDDTVTSFFNDLEMVTDSVGYAVGDAPNSQSPPVTSPLQWCQ